MMNRFCFVTLFILIPLLRLNAAEPSTAPVKITQKYLAVLCLDHEVVKEGQRSWKLPLTEHSLTFTMTNKPRSGNSNTNVDPGMAVIHFTPVSGHRYEIETRAAGESYSTRVWKKNEWKPVVRDRTTGLIVSSDPEWVDKDCRK